MKEITLGDTPEKSVPRLHEIKGNEAAKRALEVALAGNHSIAFIACTGTDAENLLRSAHRLATENNLPFYGQIFSCCPCGNATNSQAHCACSVRQIERHWRKRRNKLQNASVIVEIVPLKPFEILKDCTEEDEERILKRILAAQSIPEPESTLDNAGRNLLEAVLKHYPNTSQTGFATIIAVARTVARLAGAAIIKAHFVSEAVQYRALKLDIVPVNEIELK